MELNFNSVETVPGLNASAAFFSPSLERLKGQVDSSKGGAAKFRMPYLLRGLSITRPNQVWSVDITYGSRVHVSDGHHRRVQPLHRRVGTAQHAGQGEQR